MRRVLRRLYQPVFADQVVYSLISATTIVMLAGFMPTGLFSVFALIQAGTMYAVSLQRATVGEPALSLRTSGEIANPFGRYLFVVILSVLTFAGVAFAAGAEWWLCSLAAVPLVQDALRYRAFLIGRTGLVLISDGIWLAGSVGLLVAIRPADLGTAFLGWCVPCLASCLPLALLRTPAESRPAFRRVFALGRYGLGDIGVAISTAFLPLVLVDTLLDDSPVGAYRLAQTAFGPLNLLASTLILTQLLDSEALRALPRPALRSKWAGMTRKMVLVGAAYSVVAVIAVAVVSQSYSQEMRSQLIYAMPVTAIGAVFAVRANASIAIIRALGEYRTAMLVRVRIAVSAAIAMAVGIGLWRLTSADPLAISVLVTGFATSLLWARSCDGLLSARAA